MLEGGRGSSGGGSGGSCGCRGCRGCRRGGCRRPTRLVENPQTLTVFPDFLSPLKVRTLLIKMAKKKAAATPDNAALAEFGIGRSSSLYENVNDASNSAEQWFGLDDCVGKHDKPLQYISILIFFYYFLTNIRLFSLFLSRSHCQGAYFVLRVPGDVPSNLPDLPDKVCTQTIIYLSRFYIFFLLVLLLPLYTWLMLRLFFVASLFKHR